MIRNRSGALVAACVFVTMLTVACGGGSSSNGDKAAFCKTNADINAVAKTITSPDQVVPALKSVQDKFDSFLKNAPSEVKSDAQLLVDTARKAISTGDATPLETDAKVQTAGSKIDSFCGQSSSSSASSTASSSALSASSGDKAAFCTTNGEISAQLSGLRSSDQVVTAFKAVQDKFDSLLNNAPSEVKSDTQLLVDAARKAISTNDASPFFSDPNLQAASTKVDTFCGQSSSSSASSSSTDATSSS